MPKQYSRGGKDKLGGISKQRDRCLRSFFTAGALAVIRYAKIHGTGPPLAYRIAWPVCLLRYTSLLVVLSG